ncbi:MAG: ABC transporter ATP-binding protein [Phycisphaerae bacterium]
MKQFFQALRFVWPYRWRIVLAWVCAVLIGGLWVGSFSAILPMFNLLFQPPERGVRFSEQPDPDHPGRLERVLEASDQWHVVRDEKVERFEVKGQTVRVAPDVRVVRSEEGLMHLAQKAEAKGRFYASSVRVLADWLPKDRFKSLVWVMAAVVAMSVARGALTYVNDYLVGHGVSRAMLSLRLRVYDRVLRARLALFSRIGAGDIMSRFQQDCFLITEGMKTILGKVVREPIKAAACLVGAVWIGVSIDPYLPVIVLVSAPVVGVLVRSFARRMRRASRKALESQATLVEILEESLLGIRAVKGYMLEGHERKKFFVGGRRLFKQQLRAVRIDAVTSPVVETIFMVVAVAAVLVGIKMMIDRGLGAAGVEELTLFLALLVGALDPIRKLSNVNNRLQQAASGAQRVFELLESESEPRYGATGQVLPRLRERIEFRGVSFAYSGGSGPVLRDINLTVRRGEVLAVIGRTGCGKTTLVSLIPRFFDPTEGAVLIDGTDIQEVTLRSLRDQIAIVTQETILFGDSAANNIAFGARQSAKAPARREIVVAARAAHADEFIRNLPDGYDTVLAERGGSLSGGERQRLALARAIIRDPTILILDEATSALDEETQQKIQDTLRAFAKNRTTFLIAHRLSTLSIVDRIAIMDAGRIVDVGTHEELLERCALYRRLRDIGLDGGP